MSGLWLVWRAIRDTWDNLVGYTLVSILWWASIILIVPAPSATLALYLHTDPRNGVTTDRPTFGDTFRLILARLWPAWQLALLTFPVAALLIYNIVFYGSTASRIGVIAPFWLLIFVFWFAIAQCAFAVLALNENLPDPAYEPNLPTGRFAPRFRTPFEALKLAVIIVGARLPVVIVLSILVWAIVIVGGFVVVPLFTFVPALVANIFSRLALQTLRIPIVDPNAPTPERRLEKPAQRGRKWFGP